MTTLTNATTTTRKRKPRPTSKNRTGAGPRIGPAIDAGETISAARDPAATLLAEEGLTIEEARRIIAVGITRDAVTRYHEAVKGHEEAVKRCSDDRTLDRWVEFLAAAMDDAADNLIRAILTWHHGDRLGVVHHGQCRYFPPCSIEVGGVIYAAVPGDPDDCDGMEVGELGKNTARVMTLVVIPPESFAELDVDEFGSIVSEYRERLDRWRADPLARDSAG